LDAAVAGRISRVMSGVQCGSILIELLHERHRRVFILQAAMHWLLRQDREDALGSRVLVGAGRNGGHRDQRVAAIEISALVGQTYDQPWFAIERALAPQ